MGAQCSAAVRRLRVPAGKFVNQNVSEFGQNFTTITREMEKSINRIYSEFTYHFDDVYQRSVQFYVWCLSRADPRVEKWPLMASPVPTLMFTLSYLLVVYYGRHWMKNRKPFSLRFILVPYNLSMCLLNFYIALELAVTQYRKQYSWFCQPVNYSNDPDDIRIAAALWWYYISRLVEMTDTIFLVMRKKKNQLTFLHIYHHSTMFCLWWIGVKWVPGGSAFFCGHGERFCPRDYVLVLRISGLWT